LGQEKTLIDQRCGKKKTYLKPKWGLWET